MGEEEEERLREKEKMASKFVLVCLIATLLAASCSAEKSFGDPCKASKHCLDMISSFSASGTVDLCSYGNGITMPPSGLGGCSTTNFETCDSSCNSSMYSLTQMTGTVNGQVITPPNIKDLNYVCVQSATKAKLQSLCPETTATPSAPSVAVKFEASSVLFIVTALAGIFTLTIR